MKRKDSHQSKPVEEQGRYPKRPSLLLNNKTRRKVEYFPGHCSQARRSPFENFRAPRNQGTFWYKIYPEGKRHTRADEESNPATGEYTTENIGRKESLSRSRRNSQREKIHQRLPEHFGTTSNDVRNIEPQKEPLKRTPQVNTHIRHDLEARKTRNPRC